MEKDDQTLYEQINKTQETLGSLGISRLFETSESPNINDPINVAEINKILKTMHEEIMDLRKQHTILIMDRIGKHPWIGTYLKIVTPPNITGGVKPNHKRFRKTQRSRK